MGTQILILRDNLYRTGDIFIEISELGPIMKVVCIHPCLLVLQDLSDSTPSQKSRQPLQLVFFQRTRVYSGLNKHNLLLSHRNFGKPNRKDM